MNEFYLVLYRTKYSWEPMKVVTVTNRKEAMKYLEKEEGPYKNDNRYKVIKFNGEIVEGASE